jgi:uncharacterized protein YbdZ (MbtH family)
MIYYKERFWKGRQMKNQIILSILLLGLTVIETANATCPPSINDAQFDSLQKRQAINGLHGSKYSLLSLYPKNANIPHGWEIPLSQGAAITHGCFYINTDPTAPAEMQGLVLVLERTK